MHLDLQNFANHLVFFIKRLGFGNKSPNSTAKDVQKPKTQEGTPEYYQSLSSTRKIL